MATTINSETIKRLADEVGEDTVSLLLNVFSDELEQYSKQLSAHPSVDQIGEISHAIKSSAASFGQLQARAVLTMPRRRITGIGG